MNLLYRKLSNGVVIPGIGLGTYPMKGCVLTTAVYNAYLSGYRLIDTAVSYYNEVELCLSLVRVG